MARFRSTINLAAARQVIGGRAETAMRAVMIDAEDRLTDKLSQPGTGRTYTRGGVTHTASAEGEPPAPDTGDLRRSKQSEILRGADSIHGILAVNKEYALSLEVGTEKVKPRPFMTPLMRENSARWRDLFARWMRR